MVDVRLAVSEQSDNQLQFLRPAAAAADDGVERRVLIFVQVVGVDVGSL